jgi:hypothetical protein
MLGYKTVDVTENDTGDALFSEVLGLPLIMRGEPSTPLFTPKNEKFSGAFGGRTLCEVLGLPTISASSGKRLTHHNTTFGGFLPEIWR